MLLVKNTNSGMYKRRTGFLIHLNLTLKNREELCSISLIIFHKNSIPLLVNATTIVATYARPGTVKYAHT